MVRRRRLHVTLYSYVHCFCCTSVCVHCKKCIAFYDLNQMETWPLLWLTKRKRRENKMDQGTGTGVYYYYYYYYYHHHHHRHNYGNEMEEVYCSECSQTVPTRASGKGRLLARCSTGEWRSWHFGSGLLEYAAQKEVEHLVRDLSWRAAP